MLEKIQKIIHVLFNTEVEHQHTVVVKPDVTLKLKKELSEARKKLSVANIQLSDSVAQSNLWMRKSAAVQDKLSASQGHVTVLEDVLQESNRTIEALNAALELQEKEKTSGLQTYIDELEKEIDEAVELIQKYGLELRKA